MSAFDLRLRWWRLRLVRKYGYRMSVRECAWYLMTGRLLEREADRG